MSGSVVDTVSTTIHHQSETLKKPISRTSGGLRIFFLTLAWIPTALNNMRGKRVSSHNWNPAACSAKTKFDNIVIIDVDCDSSENVVVVDVPDSIKKKLLGSRGRKGERIIPFHEVISIDDDNEDADLPGPSGTAAGRDGLDSDSISTRRNYVDSDVDTDDCRVVPDQHSTSESSEFNNHQSNEHFSGRRVGLSPDLEEATSENEFSDCEIMGDSSGDIRRQWEEAFLRRKHDRLYGQVGFGDGVRGSTNQCDGGVNKDGQFPDGPVSSPPNDFNITDNASVFGNPTWDTFSNCNFFDQLHRGADHGQFSKEKFFPEEGFKSSHNDTGVNVDSDEHFAGNENPSYNGEFFFRKEQGPQESFPSFDQAKVDKERNHISTCFNSEDDQHSPSPCSNDRDGEANADGKESAPGNSHLDEHEAVICELGDAPTDKRVLNGVEQIFPKQPPDNEVLCERKSTGVQELPKRSQEESVSEAACIAQSCGERNTLDCEAASSAPVTDGDLINGREKLKESYEYKRAIEEEWASRQWQLQLQAEEVQRLRRKKRAETTRKLDMERRQKQRLDEIRETQKKDVETMNLREQLRAEIRSELSRLELTCFDMASLLRGLGIHVPGQPLLSKGVHAAYKKALLKFHPDRASTKDIRQQVEAEEKFKLISRMKEKFPFT